jgi:hypothetical protein
MRGHRNFEGIRISNCMFHLSFTRQKFDIATDNTITEECIMRVVEYIKSYAEK